MRLNLKIFGSYCAFKNPVMLDKAVYIRFVSVYRDFKDVDEFSAELRSLN